MKRNEIVAAAKLMNVDATGKNDEILARIELRLKEINAVLNPPPRGQQNPTTGVRLAGGRKVEDGRRGVHPITGEIVYL